MTTTTVAAEPRNGLDRYFKITERGSTVGREIRGGLATFFTMAYIVVLNPLIIGTVPDKTGAVLGIPKVAAATALVAGVMTILMGVAGRFPLAIATGLGLNAFVAATLAPAMTWPEAMGLVVVEGIVIAILVLTGFRTAIFRAVPEGLKAAIGVGIGLFIALIGFVDGGFVRRVPNEANTTVPVQLGISNNLQSWPALVFVLGLLVTAVLVARRVKGAILIGIIGTTILAIIVEALAHAGPTVVKPGVVNPKGWSLNVPKLPGIHHIAGTPDLSLVGHFTLYGAFARVGVLAAILFAFTLVLADFFDAMGTVVGIGSEAGLLDERGAPPNIGTILFVDGLAAVAGGAGSVSSATGYVESAAGVGEGARTGLANVVTGVLFLVAMFLAPIVQIVPFEAATPALVVVGFLMMSQIRRIDFSDYEIAIPAFLTMVIMPFTYSITNGMGAGFISYVVIKTVRGRAREVHPLLWLVAALFVAYYAIVPIKAILGVS
ncbi:NCS2 family permease [Actinoallomurus oryzae]|uniref:NCS2 family permease n=1 Tax=Actinoallomurus oryzae TaxID=502180 RepID=A0ABP8PIY1_9ACTN|nr:NCS2 family permease [Actinoallomurus sp. NBC_01490]